MTRDELRNIMNEYFDGHLSGEETKRVQSFLEEYEDVAKEYETFGKMISTAENLVSGIEAPGNLIDALSEELLSRSIEKYENEKQKKLRAISEEKDHRFSEKLKEKQPKKFVEADKTGTDEKHKRKISAASLKIPFTLLIVALLAAGGYFIYDHFNDNLPWPVKSVKGTYQINNQTTQAKMLDKNQTLNTLDSAVVQVTIPKVGRIEVRENSSVILLEGRDSDNKITLIAGKIRLNTRIDEPNLIVITGAVTVHDLGGNFSVEIENTGSVILTTGNGIVNLISPRGELLLVHDYTCRVLSNGTIGIPYHKDASTILIDAAASATMGGITDEHIDIILNNADFTDGITLWYLLKEVKNDNKKSEIFNKLNELFPVPPGVSLKGILAGNENMLEIWRDDIEWQI